MCILHVSKIFKWCSGPYETNLYFFVFHVCKRGIEAGNSTFPEKQTMTSTPLQKPSSTPIRLKMDEFCAYKIHHAKSCSLSYNVSGYEERQWILTRLSKTYFQMPWHVYSDVSWLSKRTVFSDTNFGCLTGRSSTSFPRSEVVFLVFVRNVHGMSMFTVWFVSNTITWIGKYPKPTRRLKTLINVSIMEWKIDPVFVIIGSDPRTRSV